MKVHRGYWYNREICVKTEDADLEITTVELADYLRRQFPGYIFHSVQEIIDILWLRGFNTEESTSITELAEALTMLQVKFHPVKNCPGYALIEIPK